jgi:hypothetical protein
LPRVYVADHWKLAWVGLDIAQVAMLLMVTWAAHRRRMVLVFFANIAATLFVVDAWFDVTTARSGVFRQSLTSAVLVEIPAAIVLYVVSWLTVKRSTATWLLERNKAVPPSVWQIEIPYDVE